MTEILKPDFSHMTSLTVGLRQTSVTAVVLVPVYTYIVEILLGIVSIAALVQVYFWHVDIAKRSVIDNPGKSITLLGGRVA